MTPVAALPTIFSRAPGVTQNMTHHNPPMLSAGLLAVLGLVAGCTASDGKSCSVTQTSNGGAVINCEDGTSATIPPGTAGANGTNGTAGTNGTNGAAGTNGTDGVAGTSCTVADNGDGSKTISCGDGTTVTVRDPVPGIVTPARFTGLSFPNTDADKRAARASSAFNLDGVVANISYNVTQRSGDDPAGNGSRFGRMVDRLGAPILQEDGSEFISNDTDFSSLLPVGNRLFSVTHFESRPGGMYLTEYNQDAATGALTPLSTQPIDFSGVDGLWVPCAGSVTPWGTHLGGEEYPPDARAFESLPSTDPASAVGSYTLPMFRYYGIDVYTDADNNGTIDATMADVRSVFSPYYLGYTTEVAVAADGTPTVAKHYAMGRVAIELSYVMPDQRTVYTTDDGTNVGLFMFVADIAGDLDAGRLYAMKWNQISPTSGGRADIEWVPMDTRSVTSAEIRAAVHSGTQFSDIFDVEGPNADGTCPTAGFKAVMRTSLTVTNECLRLRPNMGTVASRLETTRYAAYLGATTELRKEEGIAFDFDTNTLYVAMSEVNNGMVDAGSRDKAGPNHVRVPENNCGVVYALPTAPDATIGSRYVAQRWIGVVAGRPVDGDPLNSCDKDAIANPDNVTFMTGMGILIIGEDTGSGHQNDAVWAYNIYDGTLTRILTTPYGSETTSPYWYPNINGWAYLRTTIQHPYGESDGDQLMDPAEARAYDGFVGPFPTLP